MNDNHGERLARIEEKLDSVKSDTAIMRQTSAAHDQRLDAIETRQERVDAHLSWMKGIWLAVQGTVLAWLGLKG